MTSAHPEALPLALQPEDERLAGAVKLLPVLNKNVLCSDIKVKETLVKPPIKRGE